MELGQLDERIFRKHKRTYSQIGVDDGDDDDDDHCEGNAEQNRDSVKDEMRCERQKYSADEWLADRPDSPVGLLAFREETLFLFFKFRNLRPVSALKGLV